MADNAPNTAARARALDFNELLSEVETLALDIDSLASALRAAIKASGPGKPAKGAIPLVDATLMVAAQSLGKFSGVIADAYAVNAEVH